uniref:Reverse transcriptase RNase H-like domain-containing protein n=1 Tax=Romanomermis culicivorax TaxID=13658 RepID=A0A915IGN1_ROMCU
MLSEDATHIAQPVRQVPIARCAAVEKEVKQMVTNDIWERVTMFSTLALNLVTVPKPDGRKFTLVMDHQAFVSILAQSGSGPKAHKFDQWPA